MKLAGALVALIVLAAACDDSADGSGIERAEFVATLVDLRAAAVLDTLDRAGVDSILDAHGVSDAELRAYVEARSHDPDALADTWREILDSVVARDSAAAQQDTAAQLDTI